MCQNILWFVWHRQSNLCKFWSRCKILGSRINGSKPQHIWSPWGWWSDRVIKRLQHNLIPETTLAVFPAVADYFSEWRGSCSWIAFSCMIYLQLAYTSRSNQKVGRKRNSERTNSCFAPRAPFLHVHPSIHYFITPVIHSSMLHACLFLKKNCFQNLIFKYF